LSGSTFSQAAPVPERREVEQTNERVRTAQALPQGFADLAGRAGDENPLHERPFRLPPRL
jgi:hypothetical protein